MHATHSRFGVTAGGIITNGDGRVLLLKHRFRPGSGWGMPGGYLKKGEQPHVGLKRELREEAGLEIEDLKLFTVRTFKRPQQVEIVFLCRAVGDTEELNYEIEEARWFKIDDLPVELPKDQLRLIKRAFSNGAVTQD